MTSEGSLLLPLYLLAQGKITCWATNIQGARDYGLGYPGGGWWWSERLNWVSHAKGIITKYTPHELNHSTEWGLNSRQLQREKTTSLGMRKTYVGEKSYFHGRGLLSSKTIGTGSHKEATDVQTTPFYKLNQKS